MSKVKRVVRYELQVHEGGRTPLMCIVISSSAPGHVAFSVEEVELASRATRRQLHEESWYFMHEKTCRRVPEAERDWVRTAAKALYEVSSMGEDLAWNLFRTLELEPSIEMGGWIREHLPRFWQMHYDEAHRRRMLQVREIMDR